MTRSIVLLAAALLAGQVALAQAPVISDAWARPTVAGQRAGGGYLRIDNKGGGADRLLGVAGDAAARIELHNMTVEGDVMRMRQVQAIDVPAGGSVELRPGGMHLMFMDLKAPLKVGAQVPLTLKFEKAGEVKVNATVRDSGADKAHGHKH